MVLESVSYLLTSTAIYLKITFLVLLFRLRVDVEPSFVFSVSCAFGDLNPDDGRRWVKCNSFV